MLRNRPRSRVAAGNLSKLVEALNDGKLVDAEVLIPEDADPSEEVTVVLWYLDQGYGFTPGMLDEIMLYAGSDVSVESSWEDASMWVQENARMDESVFNDYLEEEMEGVDPGDEDEVYEANLRAQENYEAGLTEDLNYVEWTTTWDELEEALAEVTNERNLRKI